MVQGSLLLGDLLFPDLEAFASPIDFFLFLEQPSLPFLESRPGFLGLRLKITLHLEEFILCLQFSFLGGGIELSPGVVQNPFRLRFGGLNLPGCTLSLNQVGDGKPDTKGDEPGKYDICVCIHSLFSYGHQERT